MKKLKGQKLLSAAEALLVETEAAVLPQAKSKTLKEWQALRQKLKDAICALGEGRTNENLVRSLKFAKLTVGRRIDLLNANNIKLQTEVASTPALSKVIAVEQVRDSPLVSPGVGIALKNVSLDEFKALPSVQQGEGVDLSQLINYLPRQRQAA